MTKETRTAWTVAAVLAGIVIILLSIMAYSWYEKRNDIGYVLEDGRDAVVDQRESIREKCAAGAESVECQEAIQELSDILSEFSVELQGVQRATTTDVGGQ